MKVWECEKCRYRFGNAAFHSHARCRATGCNWPHHRVVEQ